MVVQRDVFSHLKHWRMPARQNPRSNQGMRLHCTVLFWVKLAGLEQNLIGNANLADIVQTRRNFDLSHLIQVQACCFCQECRKMPNPVSVPPGGVVSVLGGIRQTCDRLELRHFKISGALSHAGFELRIDLLNFLAALPQGISFGLGS